MELRALISGSTLALVMAATPSIVSAQGACVAYEPLRRVMQENGVRLEGSGRINMGNGSSAAIEIWVSSDQQWAIMAVDQDGIACIILSGAGWTDPERL